MMGGDRAAELHLLYRLVVDASELLWPKAALSSCTCECVITNNATEAGCGGLERLLREEIAGGRQLSLAAAVVAAVGLFLIACILPACAAGAFWAGYSAGTRRGARSTTPKSAAAPVTPVTNEVEIYPATPSRRRHGDAGHRGAAGAH